MQKCQREGCNEEAKLLVTLKGRRKFPFLRREKIKMDLCEGCLKDLLYWCEEKPAEVIRIKD